MITTVLTVVLNLAVIYLLIGAICVVIAFRRDTAIMRAAMSAGAHADRARTGGFFQQPEVELGIMLFFATLKWPSIMYTRVRDAHARKNDVEHQHVLQDKS